MGDYRYWYRKAAIFQSHPVGKRWGQDSNLATAIIAYDLPQAIPHFLLGPWPHRLYSSEVNTWGSRGEHELCGEAGGQRQGHCEACLPAENSYFSMPPSRPPLWSPELPWKLHVLCHGALLSVTVRWVQLFLGFWP